ncbi:hypothetical protein RYX36_004824 [Vicia faba]
MENCDFASRILEEPSNDESCKRKNKKTKANRERSNKPSKKLKKKTSNKAELPLAFKEKIEQMGGDEKIDGIYVSLLDHGLNLWDEMCLKKWKMETAEVYNITDGWNELVADNKWTKGQKVLVQLWSFRRNHKLYFALVKLSKDE